MRLVFVATLFALALILQPGPARAQSAQTLQDVLNVYLQAKGWTQHVIVDGYWSAVVPCPSGRRCTWSQTVVMASFSPPKGAVGQALFTNNAKCPSCFTVLVAGTGVMPASEIAKHGVDAASAETLASGQHIKCNLPAIDALQTQVAGARNQNKTEQEAYLTTNFAVELEACYISGKAGGAFWSKSPLWDLWQAAGTLSAVSETWHAIQNQDRRCRALNAAIQIYTYIPTDTSVSNPPDVNVTIRKEAPALLAMERQALKKNCP